MSGSSSPPTSREHDGQQRPYPRQGESDEAGIVAGEGGEERCYPIKGGDVTAEALPCEMPMVTGRYPAYAGSFRRSAQPGSTGAESQTEDERRHMSSNDGALPAPGPTCGSSRFVNGMRRWGAIAVKSSRRSRERLGAPGAHRLTDELEDAPHLPRRWPRLVRCARRP